MNKHTIDTDNYTVTVNIQEKDKKQFAVKAKPQLEPILPMGKDDPYRHKLDALMYQSAVLCNPSNYDAVDLASIASKVGYNKTKDSREVMPEDRIVWKAIMYFDAVVSHKGLAKLYIPEDADVVMHDHELQRRDSNVGEFKCRASKALVLELYDKYTMPMSYAWSIHEYCNTVDDIRRTKPTYTKGQYVHPDKWNNDPTKICTHGIHFFVTRKLAEAY